MNFILLLSLVTCDPAPQNKDYIEALGAAKEPTQQKIVSGLTYLRPDNKELQFNQQFWVRMSHLGSTSDYPDNPTLMTLKWETWLTAYPQLKKECKNYGENKQERMCQLLGIPYKPGSKTQVKEYFIPLNKIFRPCPDPEISDTICQLFVLIENQVFNGFYLENGEPWFCVNTTVQTSQNWTYVQPSHLEWMCNNWKNSYGNTNQMENYPWTGLGYTYNWGNGSSVGLSEFIVSGGTEVQYIGKWNLEEYCKDSD